MPDEAETTQAPAAADNNPSGVQPSDPITPSSADLTTKDTSTQKGLTPEEASAILEQADAEAKARRTRDPLADPEDSDPLADPQEGDPLGIGELDEVLPTDDTTTEETDPETQPEAEVEVDPEGEPETEPEAEVETPKRIRLNLDGFTPQERAILMEARRTGKSYEETKETLFGKTESAPTVEAKADPATPATPQKSSAAIQAEIDSLKAERRTATKEFDQEKNLEITEKLETAYEQLTEARAREAAVGQRYQSAVEASVASAATDYPDALKPGTALHDAIKADKARLERANPAFFDDPEWPETLVLKHAAKLGIAKATASKEVAPQPTPEAPKPKAKPQPAKAARPVPAPAPGGRTEGVNFAQSIQQRLAEARAKGDSAAVDKIMVELERAQQAA